MYVCVCVCVCACACVCEWVETGYSTQWCFENFIQHRSMKRARDVRDQLDSLLQRVEIEPTSNVQDNVAVRKVLSSQLMACCLLLSVVNCCHDILIVLCNVQAVSGSELHSSSVSIGLSVYPHILIGAACVSEYLNMNLLHTVSVLCRNLNIPIEKVIHLNLALDKFKCDSTFCDYNVAFILIFVVWLVQQ